MGESGLICGCDCSFPANVVIFYEITLLFVPKGVLLLISGMKEEPGHIVITGYMAYDDGMVFA